jgi:glycosyltransferase involved in cell wall biosynthesis
LLEAMSCQVPVVASKVGGIPDLVDESVGFLVKEKDSKDISAKIIKLLSNEKLRVKLGAEGRKRALEKFDSEDKVQKTIKVYNLFIR